ncbi:hypothetical protein PybrP1_010309 [[Pythium] brassicae (nom. inval.)]|nr:hypothetical protein PybrP1_010309 [[Pythium] brassicae (nom. inval.)]
MHGRGSTTGEPLTADHREWVKHEKRSMEGAGSRSALAGAPQLALPGISSLLHQQQPQQRPLQLFRQQHGHDDSRAFASDATHGSNRLAQHPERHTPTLYAQLLATSHDADAGARGVTTGRSPPEQYSPQDAASRAAYHAHAEMRGGSPNLDAFKSIGIADQHAFRASFPLRRAESLRRSRSTGSDGAAARTHTSYKLKSGSSSAGGTHGAASASASGSASASVPASQSHQRPGRMSRYLRESDRRNILRRIENGEKQADLAKEYQVSRAAISNLKQRRSRKDHQALVPEADRDGDAALERQPASFEGGAHRATSHSRDVVGSATVVARVTPLDALGAELLFARLVDQRTDRLSFHNAAMRVARLLLERALGALATQRVEIAIPATPFRLQQHQYPHKHQPARSHASFYAGVAAAKPVCAVAVTERAIPLLQEFQAMEPQSATGFIPFPLSSPASSGAVEGGPDTRRPLARLPRDMRGSSVLVLATLCSRHSVHELVAAVQEVLTQDVAQEDVCIVTLCSHERELAQVLTLFPLARAVTGKVLPEDGGNAPASALIGHRSSDTIEFLHSRLLACRQSL